MVQSSSARHFGLQCCVHGRAIAASMSDSESDSDIDTGSGSDSASYVADGKRTSVINDVRRASEKFKQLMSYQDSDSDLSPDSGPNTEKRQIHDASMEPKSGGMTRTKPMGV